MASPFTDITSRNWRPRGSIYNHSGPSAAPAAPVAEVARPLGPASPAAAWRHPLRVPPPSPCRQLKFRNSGNPEFRKNGTPVFDPTPICVPPCPNGQKRNNATGNCECPGGQEPIGEKCLPKCEPTKHREGEGCVPDCDLSKNDMINGKCLPKCEPTTHREGEGCIPDCNLETHEIINGKCLPKCTDGKERDNNGQCVDFCKSSQVRIDGVCKNVGSLLSSLISTCYWKQVGTKGNPAVTERLYTDLFKIPPPRTGSYMDHRSDIGLSLNQIVANPEFKYHREQGPGFFKAVSPGGNIESFLGGNGEYDMYIRELKKAKETAMPKIMEGISDFFNGVSKTSELKQKLVAFFFDIAIIIYSLYYKKNDNTDTEKQKASLRKVYYAFLKPFIFHIPELNKIAGGNDEANIKKFIEYYNIGSKLRDDIKVYGKKRSDRMKVLVSQNKTGGRRKTIKRKHRYSRKLKNHHKKTRKHSKKHTRKHK